MEMSPPGEIKLTLLEEAVADTLNELLSTKSYAPETFDCQGLSWPGEYYANDGLGL